MVEIARLAAFLKAASRPLCGGVRWLFVAIFRAGQVGRLRALGEQCGPRYAGRLLCVSTGRVGVGGSLRAPDHSGNGRGGRSVVAGGAVTSVRGDWLGRRRRGGGRWAGTAGGVREMLSGVSESFQMFGGWAERAMESGPNGQPESTKSGPQSRT
jgi:hypothetical protein